MKVQLYQDLLTINWNLLFSLITVVVLVLILKKYTSLWRQGSSRW